MTPEQQKYKKILVIRVGRIGDMVAVTPAILSLIELGAETEISLLTTPDGVRLFKNYHPAIRNIWVYNRKRLLAVLERKRIRKLIRELNFDLIVNLELKPSFRKLYAGLPVTCLELSATPEEITHYTKRCLYLTHSIGAPDCYTWLPVESSSRTDIDIELNEYGITDRTFLIGLHPSYSGKNKRFSKNKKSERHRVWPIEYWAELAREINRFARKSNLDVRIVADLTPHEARIAEPLFTMAGDAVILLKPKPGFERYKALLQRMDLLITPNSGPMHLAAAVGTRVLALFSAWSPEECGPYVKPGIVTTITAETFNSESHGLADIKPESVFKEVTRILVSTSR